jgi:aspartate 1-decarboxylase
MKIEILKSKIHRAKVTEADINYVGSITIDEILMNAANLIEFEKVHVLNINNGERIETYVIKGKKGSGTICLNGAAARKFIKNDLVIIASYCQMDFEQAKKFKPVVVFPDTNNKLPKNKKG